MEGEWKRRGCEKEGRRKGMRANKEEMKKWKQMRKVYRKRGEKEEKKETERG